MDDKNPIRIERKPMTGKQAFLTIGGIIITLAALAIAPAVVIAAWGWLL